MHIFPYALQKTSLMSKLAGPEKNYIEVFFLPETWSKIQILTANTDIALTVFSYSCMHTLTVFGGVDTV
jgi:hypothetical protein